MSTFAAAFKTQRACGFGDTVVVLLRYFSFALLWPKATDLPLQAAK